MCGLSGFTTTLATLRGQLGSSLASAAGAAQLRWVVSALGRPGAVAVRGSQELEDLGLLRAYGSRLGLLRASLGGPLGSLSASALTRLLRHRQRLPVLAPAPAWAIGQAEPIGRLAAFLTAARSTRGADPMSTAGLRRIAARLSALERGGILAGARHWSADPALARRLRVHAQWAADRTVLHNGLGFDLRLPGARRRLLASLEPLRRNHFGQTVDRLSRSLDRPRPPATGLDTVANLRLIESYLGARLGSLEFQRRLARLAPPKPPAGLASGMRSHSAALSTLALVAQAARALTGGSKRGIVIPAESSPAKGSEASESVEHSVTSDQEQAGECERQGDAAAD